MSEHDEQNSSADSGETLGHGEAAEHRTDGQQRAAGEATNSSQRPTDAGELPPEEPQHPHAAAESAEGGTAGGSGAAASATGRTSGDGAESRTSGASSASAGASDDTSQDHTWERAGSGGGTSGGSGSSGDAGEQPGSGGDSGDGGGDNGGQGSGAGSEPAGGGRSALRRALWPPKVTRAQLIVALLLFVLGLGLAIQVRSTSENSSLRGARHEDLVRILDELDNRTKRLEDEKQNLERQRTELDNSSDQAQEARRQTRQKERQLGVLAGTVGAEGPGIQLKVTDRGGAVEADMLLDTVQELRAAGAEAIEVNNVRVVADTYFSDADKGVKVDGHSVQQPYTFKVIGKPQDLEPALNIPGGVVQTLQKEQATATVDRSGKVQVDALRPAKRPDYARSSSQ